MGTAVTVVSILLEGAGWLDRKQGQGGGEEEPGRGRDRNSEEDDSREEAG